MRSVHVMSFIFAGAVAVACAAETEDTAHPPAAPAVGGEAGSYETGGEGGGWEPSSGGEAGGAGEAGTAGEGGTGGKKQPKDGGTGGKEPTSGGGTGGTGATGGTVNTGGTGSFTAIDSGIITPPLKDGGTVTLGSINMTITAADTELAPAPLIGSISSTDFWVEYDNTTSSLEEVTIKSAEITFTVGSQSLTIPMFSSPNAIKTKGNFAKTVQHIGTTFLNQSLTDAYCSGDAEIEVVFERDNGTTSTKTFGPFSVDC